MKKILALIAVLTVAAILFSCNKGGNSTALISTLRTVGTSDSATKNTSRTQISTTKATTSKKPSSPADPGIQEINEAIEKTLALDSYTVNQGRNSKMETQYVLGTSLKNGSTFSVDGASTGTPSFVVREMFSDTSPTYIDDIYYTDGTYYVSMLGTHAKFDTSEGLDIQNICGHHRELLQKIPTSYTPSAQIHKNYTLYTVELQPADALQMFPDIITSYEEKIYLYGPVQTALHLGKCSLRIHVTADGYISEYTLIVAAELFVPDLMNLKLSDLTIYEYAKYESFSFDYTDDLPYDKDSYTELSSYKNIHANLFNSALEKTNALESMSANMKNSIKIYNAENSYKEIIISGTKQVQDISGNPIWRESSTLSDGNNVQSVDVYFANGYYYINNNGAKQKYPAKEYEEIFGTSVQEQGSKVLLPEYISDFMMNTERNSFGERTLYLDLKINEDVFKKEYYSYIQSTVSVIASGYDIARIDISDAVISATIDDNGFLSKYSVLYNMDIIIDINGSNFAVTVSVIDELAIVAPGSPCSVVAPDGYEDYPTANTDIHE